MDFPSVTGKLWEIWLEYEDVFGRRFCAVHHKRPIQEENRRLIPGLSVDYIPPQPWVTFTEDQQS